MSMQIPFENSPVLIDHALTAHLFGTQDTSFKRRGEYELLQAILEDAICCFRYGSNARKGRMQRLAHEAEEWLFTDDYRWPFSFLNVCAMLGLDAEYLRDGLRRWQQRHPEGVPLRQQRMPLHNVALQPFLDQYDWKGRRK